MPHEVFYEELAKYMNKDMRVKGDSQKLLSNIK